MAKEKNRKTARRRINPLDVVIILLVLCLIATFAYRLYSGVASPILKDESKLVLSFECDDEYNSMVKYLAEGDAVYLASTGELLGYLYVENEGDALINVMAEPATEESAESEEQKNEYVRIDFSGKLRLSEDTNEVSSGNYYSIGEINFSKGSQIEVFTERASFTITVTAVQSLE